MRLAFSACVFLRIRSCLRSLISCQSASNGMFSMASHPNTSCAGVACNVVCAVVRTANIVAARTASHGLGSVDLFSSNERIILPIVWCTRSIMALACGFRVVITALVAPKSCLIISANSARNSVPLSTMTLVGHGYRINQVARLRWLPCRHPY